MKVFVFSYLILSIKYLETTLVDSTSFFVIQSFNLILFDILKNEAKPLRVVNGEHAGLYQVDLADNNGPLDSANDSGSSSRQTGNTFSPNSNTNKKPSESAPPGPLSPRIDSNKRKKTLFNHNPVFQMIKSLTAFDDYLSKRQANVNANGVNVNTHSPGNRQTDEIRRKLIESNRSEDLYRVNTKYSGFGVTNDFNLEVNDLVVVIKKTDPCGNLTNWFVDNGSK